VFVPLALTLQTTFRFAHTAHFTCFLLLSAIILPESINWFVYGMLTDCVFCKMRNEALYITNRSISCLTQYLGVYWATLLMGDVNTRTWPSRLGGVSNIETIKYAHESGGAQTRERLRFDAQATTKTTDQTFVREGAPNV
jgi:hypothetical protein